MLEISDVDGAATAIVRENLVGDEIDAIADVEALWLTPEAEDFSLDCSLRISELRVLYVAHCRQPLDRMVGLDSLCNLQKLIVADAEPALIGIARLGRLADLTTFKLRQQPVSDEFVGWLSEQESLTSLALTDTDVDDSSLSRLACHSRLRRLDLFRTKVSFASAQTFSVTFPSVRSLDVSETLVSSESVESIHRLFPNLERLLCRQTKLEKSDIEAIASWDKLQVLGSGFAESDFNNMEDEFWDL